MSRSEFVDALYLFWPIPVAIFVAVATIVLGIPWLGALILIPILLARRIWWSCRFGTFNGTVIVVGVIACLIAAVRQLLATS